ncbi:hypothetical protein BDP27DRAFT_1370667 [Rhodocollybia butyracea]|uniref:Uncharacterized protein n=1 Tax=Rhodocollybia butyracea TaxID=206335 RepID=A0A9P5PCP1_9AGAR|nr:hypothetical protein BDP27DRAFT_1370667 [Rhodocollybia butyracea]
MPAPNANGTNDKSSLPPLTTLATSQSTDTIDSANPAQPTTVDNPSRESPSPEQMDKEPEGKKRSSSASKNAKTVATPDTTPRLPPLAKGKPPVTIPGTSDRTLARQSSKLFKSLYPGEKGKRKEKENPVVTPPEASTSSPSRSIAPDEREAFNETTDTRITDVSNIVGHITDSVDSQIMRVLQDTVPSTAGGSHGPISLADNEDFRDNTLTSLQVDVTDTRDVLSNLPNAHSPPGAANLAPLPLAPTWPVQAQTQDQSETRIPSTKRPNLSSDTTSILFEGLNPSETPGDTARMIFASIASDVHLGMLNAAYRAGINPAHVVLRFKSYSNATYFVYIMDNRCPTVLSGMRASPVARPPQDSITVFDAMANNRKERSTNIASLHAPGFGGGPPANNNSSPFGNW